MNFELLSKYFPPPRFLNPTHIGISFSDLGIKAVSFSGSFSKPEFKSIIIPLEAGAIVKGKIIDSKGVVDKLATLRDLFHSTFVFFTVPDELAYVFQVSVPISRGGNASESVAFTVEENVPLSLVDTVFDFVPLTAIKSETEYQVTMIVAAGVKKEVEKFIEVIYESGLELVGCVHESQAIANAIIPQNSLGMSCIAHSRKDRIGIYLIKNNTVIFSTLRSVLDGNYANQFLDEYEKFLEYSARYAVNETQSIQTTLVCGEFEYAKRAVEAIIGKNDQTKNAKLANVWTNVLKIEEITPSISYEDSLNFAGPIGLVLAPTV